MLQVSLPTTVSLSISKKECKIEFQYHFIEDTRNSSEVIISTLNNKLNIFIQ